MSSFGELKDTIESIFKTVGLPDVDAELVVDTLFFAEKTGMASHGLVRVPFYAKRLFNGGINPKPNVRVIKRTAGCAVVDGDDGMGQVSGFYAMKQAIELAKNAGIGFVLVKNASHFGMASYYTLLAEQEGMIGFAVSNTSAVMAPTGGREKMIGNNPISFAVPSADSNPILLDMALSVCALGKFIIAKQKGEKIPVGLAFTSEGNPTNDPAEALAGSALPLGDHKGYGLALIMDMLTGVLSGGKYGPDVGSLIKWDPTEATGNSLAFMALDISVFDDLNNYKKRIKRMGQRIKQSARAPGCDEILLAGERELRNKEQFCGKNFRLDPVLAKRLIELAGEIGCKKCEKTLKNLSSTA